MTISDRAEGMGPMLKPLALAALAYALWAETALANCVPPASTYFACTLRDGQKRVEFCQGPVTDGSSPDYYSYNFADGSAVSELYFTTDAPWISTKYFRGRQDNGSETLGMALEHEGYFYAFYITGIFGSPIRLAQLHVFDSQEAFQSDAGETEILRYYCRAETVLIDWTFVGP